jgi:hypothetical protein
MNKKLFLGWLNNKTKQNSPDGPILEGKRKLKREIEFLKGILANQALSGEFEKRSKDNDPFALEPKSGLIDLSPTDARHSLKLPHVLPMWSYKARNTLGIMNEAGVDPSKALAVIPKPTTTTALAKKPTTTTALAKKPTTTLAVRRKNSSSPTGIQPYAPEAKRVYRPSPKTPLQLPPGKQNLPIKRPPTTPSQSPIVKSAPPVSEPQGESEKPIGASNLLGSAELNRRDKSKYTHSVKRSPAMTAYGISPGTGAEYGGQVVSENNMSSLINHHINKFLKTKEGRQLKQEAQNALTHKEE